MYYAYARMESLRNVIPQLFTSFNSPFPSRIRDPGMTVHDKRTWITNGITLRLLQDNKINTEYRYTKYNIIVYKHVHTHKRVPTRIVLLLLWRYYIIIINNMYVRVRACILFIVNDQNMYYNYDNMYNDFGGDYARIYITTL